ncbi:hypothetical protein PR729_19035 [Providencia rettgeri]|nr:hypothetical protein PR729_19035 [Providencia rettgeri]
MDVTKHFQDAYPIHFHSHVIIDRVIYPNLPITWNASPIITEMIAPQAHLYPFLVDLRHLDSEQIPILQKMIIDSKKIGRNNFKSKVITTIIRSSISLLML